MKWKTITILILVLALGLIGVTMAYKPEIIQNRLSAITELGILNQAGTTLSDYNTSTQTIVIKDGTGTAKGSASLKTPLVYDIIGTGEQKVAQISLTANQTASDVVKSIYFTNLRTNKSETKTFKIKQLSYVLKNTSDIKEVCNTLKNGTTECSNQVVGYSIKEVESWNDSPAISLTSNSNITIGIFTDVKEGDLVEWIPTIFDSNVTQWAIYRSVISKNEFQTGWATTVLGGFRYNPNVTQWLYAVEVNATLNGATNNLTDLWICTTANCTTVAAHYTKTASASNFTVSAYQLNANTPYWIGTNGTISSRRGQGVSGYVMPTMLKYGNISCIMSVDPAVADCIDTGWYDDIKSIYLSTDAPNCWATSGLMTYYPTGCSRYIPNGGVGYP